MWTRGRGELLLRALVMSRRAALPARCWLVEWPTRRSSRLEPRGSARSAHQPLRGHGHGSMLPPAVAESLLSAGDVRTAAMLSAVEHPDVQLVRAAVAGDRGSARSLIQRLAPTVRSRITWLLLRNRAIHAQIRQELEDLTQEVFAGLFSRGGHELLSWEPGRGMALEGFVGLLAQRRVISILRSRRRSPFVIAPAPASEEPPISTSAAEQTLIEKQLLYQLVHELRERLSPLGLEMFYRLYVWDQDLELVSRECGLSKDAVYQWRSRLRAQLRQILEEKEQRAGVRSGVECP
jgi:DNA-directed RNA polymerase specialized sigma24 family protein